MLPSFHWAFSVCPVSVCPGQVKVYGDEETSARERNNHPLLLSVIPWKTSMRKHKKTKGGRYSGKLLEHRKESKLLNNSETKVLVAFVGSTKGKVILCTHNTKNCYLITEKKIPMSPRAVLVKELLNLCGLHCSWWQQQVLCQVLYKTCFLFLTLLCSFHYMQVLHIVVASFCI